MGRNYLHRLHGRRLLPAHVLPYRQVRKAAFHKRLFSYIKMSL